MRILVLWYFEQYPLKNVLHLFWICLGEKTVDYRNALLHTHTHTHAHKHMTDGAPGVSSGQKNPRDPLETKQRGMMRTARRSWDFFWVCLSMHKMQSVPAEQLRHFKYLLPNGQLEAATEPKTDTSWSHFLIWRYKCKKKKKKEAKSHWGIISRYRHYTRSDLIGWKTWPKKVALFGVMISQNLSPSVMLPFSLLFRFQKVHYVSVVA